MAGYKQQGVSGRNGLGIDSVTNRRLQFIFLLLPGFAVFFVFTIYPIMKLFVMSFFDWKLGIGQNSAFVGLTNYIKVIGDPTFKIAIANTALYALITVPCQIVIGLLIAVLLNSIKKFKVPFRVMYYLPVITSWVIVSLIFRYVFNTEGLLNYFLRDVFHIVKENITWLDNRPTGMAVAMMLGIWKGIGWNMVIFLAALQGVPIELYEASEMDGCNRVKQFFSITLPCIKNTMLFVVVMLTIGAFNVYTSIKLITDGQPAHQTEVVLTWMYSRAFEAGDFGYSAALSYIIAFAISILALIQFKVFNKYKD